MTDRELMQQALHTLEGWANQGKWVWPESALEQAKRNTTESIAALRERLAQPQMQPCAGRNCGSTNPNLHSAECFEDYEKATGMNNWQGLTDEEVFAIWIKSPAESEDRFAFVNAIMNKLKEKNT